MTYSLATLKTDLRSHWWILAAFAVPLVVRSIPEVLSGPYPLGLDTLRYISLVDQRWVFSLTPLAFLKTTGLFYALAALPYNLTGDASFVIKTLGPILLSALSVMMYLYARKGLQWSNATSLLVSVLVSTYFVSLRISWDLYRQTLGLVFLMAVLILLKSTQSPRRYPAIGLLMILTVLTQQLAAVVMFFIVGLQALGFLWRRRGKDFAWLATLTSLSGSVFVFQQYSLQLGTFVIPVMNVAPEPSVALAAHVGGLIVYCYVLILPLVFLGLKSLKDPSLKYWTILCAAIPLLTVLWPSSSFSYWNRWVYLLVYPLLFCTAYGLERLWKSWSTVKNRLRRLLPKAFALTYLSFLLVLSGCYIATTPENSFPYFSQYNPYLTYIPSSMLQTTVSSADAPSLVECIGWLNANSNGNSAIVAHYALYDWIHTYSDGEHLVLVQDGPFMWTPTQNESELADRMVTAAREALTDGFSQVYTVWWVDGEGWYQIPSLPSCFKEVDSSGRMAVYVYVPEA
ncbi:MAG: hypothetical protein ACE14S_10590 [Candidatus Bathyarchaeia archaeon]